MTADYGDEIKSRISMREVAAAYGFQVNGRMNKMRCPFHNDSKPSMQIYPGKRGWFCFVCNEGGSVIDFVMRLFGLNFLDACKKLNEDFQLGLSIGNDLTEKQKREAAQAVRKRREELRRKQEEENALWTAYHAALDRYIALDRMKMEHEPRKDAHGNYTIPKEYIYAIKNIDGAWAAVEEAETNLYIHERREQEAL